MGYNYYRSTTMIALMMTTSSKINWMSRTVMHERYGECRKRPRWGLWKHLRFTFHPNVSRSRHKETLTGRHWSTSEEIWTTRQAISLYGHHGKYSNPTTKEGRVFPPKPDKGEVKQTTEGAGCCRWKTTSYHVLQRRYNTITLSTYAILTTLVMLALESRTAAAVDIPGVYIHIDMLDFVIVIFRGTYVKVLCDVNVKYKTYINTRNRK